MTVVFPPRYLAPIGYYAAMAACDKVVIDSGARYDKRCKVVHRTDIIDTHGILQLTVPVSKCAAPGTQPLWRDREVSAHGKWWDIHRVALESAYGRTPYFQFYIDNLLPYISENSVGMPVTQLDECIDRAVRKMLHLQVDVVYADAHLICPDAMRFEQLIIPDVPRYWQVRADSHGFVPGLSIVDILFNMGPEAQIILRRMADFIKIK